MKTLYTVAFVLFITASLSFTSKTTVKENTLTATFKGLNNDDYFKFEDDDKKVILFYDVNEEIEISLYDDDLIGKKFSITYVEKEIEVFDEDGEETGEKKKVNSITALSYAK
ncbi:hypothetical protein H9I45_10510 [Polaribacter haliotis]|uniref:Uncharacterized protein n=1 Tax=Polaribacter haliotis TaxID=1888915 RepID=A0A7L8ACR1_9FLAO|nr:hypothetical protein [Polaribacter haliotis]QOD59781.1 hypothetical protein H9I45_10510 [Polaribacter haliotis]